MKTNQDNETTISEEEKDVTNIPPATEETQPALKQEKSVPSCQEGQVLDEETNFCVLEESEADETEQKEQQ